jgi:Ca-activated chloride channel family protein
MVLAGAVLAAQDVTLGPRRLFRSGVDVTSVNATVLDGEGHLVRGLERDAFEIFEDGRLQSITQFTGERVPIGLGVLLDTSDSMFGARIRDARTALDRFLFDLLDRDDEFFVLAFNHAPHLLTGWTNDPAVVRPALDAIYPSGATGAYDAVVAALPLFEQRHRQRGALLIISDGADTASDATIRDVRSALLRSDVFVYAIAIDAKTTQAINTRVSPQTLREITDPSGGRTDVVQTTDDLQASTARIAEELSNQYLLGYVSPKGADGKFHSIRVRVKGTDYRVRARNGYVARTGG